MKSIIDYFKAVKFTKSSLSTLIASAASLFIGTAVFVQSVDFLDGYFKEDRMVLEIQQNLQESPSLAKGVAQSHTV